MKKIKFIYAFVLLIVVSFTGQTAFAEHVSLRDQFVNHSNQVGTQNLPMSRPGASGILSPDQSEVSSFGGTPMSAIPQSLAKQTGLIMDSEEEREQSRGLLEFLGNNIFMRNPTVSPESYSNILGNTYFNNPSDSRNTNTRPCSSSSDSVIDQGQIENISGPLEELQDRHQYCGFDNPATIGTMHASVGFCDCVREKSMRAGESEDALYQKADDPEKLQKAMDLYRQGLVDKVMPGLLEDLDEMTSSSNDFLSTKELSHMLYEVHSGIEDKEARSVLEGMRQGMHTCSGLGMSSMINDLFNSQDGHIQSCDERSAQFLLDGVIKATGCDSGECDDYRPFVESENYSDEKAHVALSDVLTHKFSVQLIDPQHIVDDDFGRLSSDEKIRKVITTADAMTETDASGRPFVHPSLVGFDRRLPPEEQLEFMHEFMQQKKQEGFNPEVYYQENEKAFDDLMNTLVRNNLYRESSILSSSTSQMDDIDKVQKLSRFTDMLQADKDKRLEDIDLAGKYLSEDMEPVEYMKRLIVNNYLYLGDDVLKKCAETRRKVEKLCASISGNGMAIFSHPDFREHAGEMLLDEELQTEISKISEGEVGKRSPLADQLYCHANFSSLSSDCDEQASITLNRPVSSGYCYYDAMWFLSTDSAAMNRGHTGNSKRATMSLVSEANKQSTGASSSDFIHVASGENRNSYKDPDKDLNFNPDLYDSVSFGGKDSKKAGVAQKEQTYTNGPDLNNLKAKPKDNPEPEAVKNMATSKTRDFSSKENFSDSFAQRQQGQYQDAKKSAIRQSASAKNDKNTNSPIEQSGGPQFGQAKELKAELKKAKRRQQELQDQLDKLLVDSKDRDEETHEDELNKKKNELRDLEDQVKKLEANVRREKSEVEKGLFPQRPSSQKASAPSPAQTSSVRSASRANSRPTSASTPGVESSVKGRAQASSVVNEKTDAGPSPASSTNQATLRLSQGRDFGVLPQSTDLTRAAKDYADKDYVLMDIGRPGLAEKIVFEYGPSGEVMLYEIGNPVIVSREVVELDEAETAKEELEDRSPAEESKEGLGEQEESPNYRWSEVEELLDL